MSLPLNEEIALRVGLAAKALNVIEPRVLLEVLIGIMGEPITQGKIEKLRAKKVRQALLEQFQNLDAEKFEKAFAMLKGRGIQQYLNPQPDFEKGVFCEINGALRVACASDSGENIDGQFSTCVRYLIYQVSPEYIRLVDIREPKKICQKLDRNMARATLLDDCSILYTTEIGAQASAKVVKVGMHPMKLGTILNAKDALLRLQGVLSQDNPPPWLAKAMGKPSLGVKLYGERINDC